jgi:hypothetical protein
MTVFDIKCPIWNTPANQLATSAIGQKVDSPRTGGAYRITGTAATTVKSRPSNPGRQPRTRA